MISSDQATVRFGDLDVVHVARWVDAPTTTDPRPRCDMLISLEGLVQVETVQRRPDLMSVTVSGPWQLMGCPDCGVVAPSRGRRRRARVHPLHEDALVNAGLAR